MDDKERKEIYLKGMQDLSLELMKYSKDGIIKADDVYKAMETLEQEASDRWINPDEGECIWECYNEKKDPDDSWYTPKSCAKTTANMQYKNLKNLEKCSNCGRKLTIN